MEISLTPLVSLTQGPVRVELTERSPLLVTLSEGWYFSKKMKAKEININFKNLSKEGLLKDLKEKLGFPDFFGMNWDALIDCISYMRQPEAAMSEVLLDEDEVLIINCKKLLQANFDTKEFLDVVQCINDRALSCGDDSQVLLNLIS